MERINTAYLAGVLDSDGSFSITKRHIKRSKPNYVAMVQLSWKDSELTRSFMEKLVKEFGGSFASCKSTNTIASFPMTKAYLKYSATGVAAEKIVDAVLPFLCLKNVQAQNLKKLRSIVIRSPYRTDEVSEQLDFLHKFNKSLNTKNGWKNEENRIR